MWVKTDNKSIVDLEKAYFIGIDATAHDKIWVVASFPFYNGIDESQDRVFLKCFSTKEECQACIDGIFDRLTRRMS